jgi:predicted Zn-dependent protease
LTPPGAGGYDALSRAGGEVKGIAMRRLGRLWLVAAVLGPVFAGGCETVFLFSRDDEIALGRQYAPQFEKEFGGKLDDPVLQDYVSRVGSKVAAVSDRDMPYQFAVLRSATPNAFAVPGAWLYITAGLLQQMDNERQLAAVLGHEIGHIVHRDSMKGLQRQLGVEILAAIVAEAIGGGGGAAAAEVAKIVGGLSELRYSRKQEYAADQAGITYMARAGYNPWGMVELLKALERGEQTSPGSFGEMFMSHPLTSKRIDEAAKTLSATCPAAAAGTPDPNAALFLQMRARLAGAQLYRRPAAGAAQPVRREEPRGGEPARPPERIIIPE